MKKVRTPRNMTEMYLSLSDVYSAALNGDMDHTTANTAANVAGKIFRGVAIQLQYAHMRGVTPNVPYAD